jgi:hypothetical protein
MSPVAQPERRILVIANRTGPCPTLADEVTRRASEAPTDVLVVAPALNSRPRQWVSDVDEALARAQERLDLAIAALRRRGVIARGEIGDADRLLAIEDAGELPGRRDRDRDPAHRPVELDRARPRREGDGAIRHPGRASGLQLRLGRRGSSQRAGSSGCMTSDARVRTAEGRTQME